VRRFVAQSNGAFAYARTGGVVKSEQDPLDPSPARRIRGTVAALRHLEQAVLEAKWTEGIMLRYGGPGVVYLDAQQRLISVVALEIAGGQIRSISAIVNPVKLMHLGPVGDVASVVRSPRPT
jgi:hypothetical protein